MLITAALLILMLTVYLLKNLITLQTCKYTFSYSMYYYIIKKYLQSCFTVLGLGTGGRKGLIRQIIPNRRSIKSKDVAKVFFLFMYRSVHDVRSIGKKY